MSTVSPTIHRFPARLLRAAMQAGRFAQWASGAVNRPLQIEWSGVQISRSGVQMMWSVVEMRRSDSQTTRSFAQRRQSPSEICASVPEAAWPEARIARSAVQIAGSAVQTAWSRTENARQRLQAGRVGQACCLSRVPGAFCPGSSKRAKCPPHWRQVGHPSCGQQQTENREPRTQ